METKTLGKLLVIVCVAGLCLTGCRDGALESFFKTGETRILSPDKVVAAPGEAMVSPIVRDFNALDASSGPYPNAVRPTDADLVYDNTDYVIGVTDVLDISILDLYAEGLETLLRREVTESGYIDLPQLKQRIRAEGTTQYQLTADIKQAYIDNGILREPVVVSVTVVTRRKQTFSVTGAVGRPGTYQFVRPDMRLWDALALSGGVIDQKIKYIYIIRQAPATPSSEAGMEKSFQSPRPADQVRLPNRRPVEPKRRSDLEAIDALMSGPTGGESDEMVSSYAETGEVSDGPVTIQAAPSSTQPAAVDSSDATADNGDGGRWVYRDGEWVRVADGEANAPAQQTPPAADEQIGAEPDSEIAAPLEAAPEEQMTPGEPTLPADPSGPVDKTDPFGWGEVNGQDLVRVIAINREKLQRGNWQQNIVIRENDVVYIPPLEVGEFYMYGEINRPGVYSLTGREVTIKMALAAAGGIGPMGWPENSVLVRKVGDSQEQFIPINIERIWRGQDPDMLLKPDDIVALGTHWSSTFLAVLRNSFRMTYGFGFIYDRNFADPLLVTPRSNRFSRL